MYPAESAALVLGRTLLCRGLEFPQGAPGLWYGAGKPVTGAVARALTSHLTFPFPIAATLTLCVSPMADTAPNGPQGAGAVVSEPAGWSGWICKS